MIKVIICGHGNFASGINSALKLITGGNDNVIALDFEGTDDGSAIANEMKRYSEQGKVIILTDIYGGTPFRQAAMLSVGNEDVHVLTGTNLGLVIELSMMLDSIGEEENIEATLIKLAKNHVSSIELELDEEF